jgi:hypothetical protein
MIRTDPTVIILFDVVIRAILFYRLKANNDRNERNLKVYQSKVLFGVGNICFTELGLSEIN